MYKSPLADTPYTLPFEYAGTQVGVGSYPFQKTARSASGKARGLVKQRFFGHGDVPPTPSARLSLTEHHGSHFFLSSPLYRLPLPLEPLKVDPQRRDPHRDRIHEWTYQPLKG
jgi:hypothetical protein